MVLIGVDAEVAGDFKRLLDDLGGRQAGVLQQRARRGLRVGPAAADGDDAVLRLEHVAIAGDDQRMLAVGDRQHGLQAAQHAVGAPVLGQFDGGAQQVALVLLQLGLETLEQREGIRRAAGEAGQDLFVVEPPHLARRGLDYDVAERDLAVAAQRHAAAATHGKDGGAVILLHGTPAGPFSDPRWRASAIPPRRQIRAFPETPPRAC